MQVYRGLDIGTAKPSQSEQNILPHHLIDIRDPDEQFTAGDFVRLARAAISQITNRGALPVVAGGTGFYISSLVNGLPEAPPADGSIRAALKAELAEKGADALHTELAAVDPQSAGRIHVNDTYRLLRALEVFRLTGSPLSAFKAQDADDRGKEQFDFTSVYLAMERETLYRRIEARARSMFQAGLAAEVAALAARGLTPDASGLHAIGYREFFEKNDAGRWVLRKNEQAIFDDIVKNSRHYAKRQETWFRKVPALRRLETRQGKTALVAEMRSVVRNLFGEDKNGE
jgi:tRNA dimethylallyltransferase